MSFKKIHLALVLAFISAVAVADVSDVRAQITRLEAALSANGSRLTASELLQIRNKLADIVVLAENPAGPRPSGRYCNGVVKTDSDGDLQYPNEIDVVDSDGDQQYPSEIDIRDSEGDVQYPSEIDLKDAEGDWQYPNEVDMVDSDGDLQSDDEADLCSLTQCAALEPVSNTAAAPFKFTGKFNSRERRLSTMQITVDGINGTTTVIDIDPATGTVIDVQATCP